MKSRISKILEVKKTSGDEDQRYTVTLITSERKSQPVTFEVTPENPVEEWRLMQIIRFAGASSLGDLKGKKIKEILSHSGELVGYGSRSENEYFFFTKETTQLYKKVEGIMIPLL